MLRVVAERGRGEGLRHSDETLAEGAGRTLAVAFEAEVDTYLAVLGMGGVKPTATPARAAVGSRTAEVRRRASCGVKGVDAILSA